MDIVDRIFRLVDMKYKEQREFAEQLNIAASVVSAWRCRKSSSYQKRLPQIAKLLGTTVEYLLTGEKDPAGKESNEVIDEASDLLKQLSLQDQMAMLAQIRAFVKSRET